MSDQIDRVLVCIPTYNERENLPAVVRRVRAVVPTADILVLDDSSPDGTGEVADALAADDSQVQVLHRARKEGLGRAYLAGFHWGLARGYGAIVEMDADGSHQPEQLPSLLQALPDADVVIGSRWVRGGSVVNWPLHRKALSVGGNLYIRVLLGMPVHDATAGFRVYTAQALHRIGLHDVASQGYSFQTDLTRRAVALGMRVVEVPITFVEREVGNSKMSGDIMRESLRRITVWGVQHRGEQLRRLSRREPTWHRV
ncbi:polyprenol monophosphomannose synthase [Pedococcus sp. 5OH_020]|uniref:polyprenol monophosphomannose synthase n=1 Tax=Pedococcus sp. 5OH_020 TaxID=2989814 RepID=UPI0022E9FEA7|nr:polyprenol monophosphomannose synthase [Pedococcus sp. 5OH_020]